MYKKNIAFLLTKVSEKGGISRVCSIITNELQNLENFSIHVISFQQQDNHGYLWNKNIKFHNLVRDKTPMKQGIFPATFKLRTIIKKYDIKIIISCGELVAPLGVFGSFFTNANVLYWSHSSFKNTKSNKFRKLNEQFACFFSKAVISLTKTDEKNYYTETKAKKVYQIYNPIDSKITLSKNIYNANSNKIISVGRLVPQKNFICLIDVAKIVLDTNPDFVWHIYGSGKEKKALNNKIIKLGLKNRLILKGQSNNLYEIYPEYSLMVMTSKYEGFPMTLLEGMAYNLPLVSFDISTGPNEIIRNNHNGFLIKPFDKNKMANKINQLIQNKSLRIEFSKNNMQHVSEFNLSNIVEKWTDIIEKNID